MGKNPRIRFCRCLYFCLSSRRDLLLSLSLRLRFAFALAVAFAFALAVAFAFALAVACSQSNPPQNPCHSERSEEPPHLPLPLLLPCRCISGCHPRRGSAVVFSPPHQTTVISTEAARDLIVGCAAEKSASLPPSLQLKAQSSKPKAHSSKATSPPTNPESAPDPPPESHTPAAPSEEPTAHH